MLKAKKNLLTLLSLVLLAAASFPAHAQDAKKRIRQRRKSTPAPQ